MQQQFVMVTRPLVARAAGLGGAGRRVVGVRFTSNTFPTYHGGRQQRRRPPTQPRRAQLRPAPGRHCGSHIGPAPRPDPACHSPATSFGAARHLWRGGVGGVGPHMQGWDGAGRGV